MKQLISIPKQELYRVIETLPEELSSKVIDYIEYLKFVSITNTAPDNLIVKNDKDLVEKLKVGMEDTNNGNVCPIDEAFEEVEEILANQIRRFYYWKSIRYIYLQQLKSIIKI